MIDATFRIVDTETTGTKPEDAIVEVAALDVVDGCLGETRSSLVNPMRPIPPEASAVHGITDADAADAPLLAEAIPLVLTDRPPTFYVAHFIEFEKQYLGDLLDAPLICTMKCSMRVWPEASAFNLGYLRYWLCLGDLGQRANPPHRAPADVFVTSHVLGRLFGEASVDDMVAWTKEPALYPRIPFGKHEGMKWSALPDSYLDWILNKPNDLSEDIKWNARKEIVRRFGERVETYILKACAAAAAQPTVAALNTWWDDEARNRHDLDLAKGDAGYDRIVSACKARKAILSPTLETTGA